MPVTKTQNWQVVQQAALSIVGKAARSSNEDIISSLDRHIDSPLRMSATFPTADAKLNFSANTTISGDGTAKSTPSVDDLVSTFVATTLDLQTGAIVGGTLLREGAVFSMPTVVSGEYYRAVFVYRGDNKLDCKFSPTGTHTTWALMNAAAAANPGALYAALEGIPVGWIDLKATSTSAFKTASSAGDSSTSIIENAVSGAPAIFRISAGGGAGGGAVKDFKIQAIANPYATIKGGYLKIDDGRELATYNGVAYGTDLSINLDVVYGASAADNVDYYLYVDLDSLGAQVSVGARKVYAVQQAQFKILTTEPEHAQTNPRRYAHVGSIRSASTGTAWSGADSSFSTAAVRHHETFTKFFSYPETFVDESITTAVALNTLTHNLSGEPHSIYLTYDDATTEIGLDLSAHLLDVTATQIKISSLGLTLSGTQKLRVRAVRFPQQPAIAAFSRTFTSGWFTAAGSPPTAHLVPHGLNDVDDIKSYTVEEWDTDTNTYRMIDPSGLVVKFDSTNFTLNWTGILFTGPNRKYRVIAGGSPMPYAIPIEYGGFTKFVGMGPGSYATLTAAKAASGPGDAVYVARDTAEPAGDFVWDIPDTRIFQKDGTKVVLSGALTNGFRITAPRVRFDGRISLAPSGAQARGISVEAADCRINAKLELDAAQALTDVFHVTAGGVRTYAMIGFSKSAGSFTNLEINNDGAGKTDVWGG